MKWAGPAGSFSFSRNSTRLLTHQSFTTPSATSNWRQVHYKFYKKVAAVLAGFRPRALPFALTSTAKASSLFHMI